MQNKKRKNICVLLSAAMLMTALPSAAVFAVDSQPTTTTETQEVEDPTATATATATATSTATSEATADPSASTSPTPTATTPIDTEMDMDVTANIYADEDQSGVYDVTFTTDRTLPEITAFEITVSFTEATVGTAAFTDELKEMGTTKVVRGDREATFTFTEGKETLSGKLLIGSVNVTVDDKKTLNDQNIKIDQFTATTKDGGKLTIHPTVIATVGASVPDLEDNEQVVFDMIKALPQKSTISFFEDKENGVFIDLDQLETQLEETERRYNILSASSKSNVDKALAAESLSTDIFDTVSSLISSMEKSIGMIQIGYGVEDVTAENALDYGFYFEVFKDLSFNASDLMGATTALAEFNSALTAISEAQILYDEAIKDATYTEKANAILNQYEQIQKASTHVNYKKYVTTLTESATDLKEEITDDYTGSDKNVLIRLIESVIDSINQDQEIAKDLPDFDISTIYYGASWTVTLTRENTYPDFDNGTVNVTVYNLSNTKMDSGTAEFRNNSKTAYVSMTARASIYSPNQKISVHVTYEINGTTYDLGSQTATVNLRTSSGSSSSSSSTSGSNTSRPGNTIFPTVTNNPTPTQNPNDDTPLFNDLAGYEWAEEAIEGLYYAGIVNGMEEGVFNPAGLITREQFSKMVVQLFGVSTGASPVTNFNDVNVNEWYAPYITAAVQAGYVQGQSDEYFGIGEHIMRQDMATILYRALGRDQDKTEITFSDADQIASYAYDAISELVGLGALNGYEDGTFKPRGTATRAEAAKVIWSVYNTIHSN